MNYIKTILLLLPFFLNAQNTKITILDNLDKKPINGIQILSENGSLITNSNTEGNFEFDISILKQLDIKSIMIYDSKYIPVEFKLDDIPDTVYLEKSENYELKPVIITKKKSKEYFTLKGYVRSWQLVNNKLVKYGDVLVEYHIPYDLSRYNDFNTGIKTFALEYRTFKTDSIKQKSRIISISTFDSFLNYHIPKRDEIARVESHYKLERVKDSLYIIFDEGKNVGYTIKDKNNKVSEVNVSNNFEGKEAMKFLLWKFSGSYKTIEKWTGDEETRHLSYFFSNEKTLVETKTKEKYNAVETINEIFIDGRIIFNDKKPEKYKSHIDKDRSFYNTEYWKEQLANHPMPSAIKEQLKFIKENKNDY